MHEASYTQPAEFVEQLGSPSRAVQMQMYAALMDYPLDQRTDSALLVEILERLPEDQPFEFYEKYRLWLSEKVKRALIAHGTEATMPVITLLQDRRSYLRAWAADILAQGKDERALQPLLAALFDERQEPTEVGEPDWEFGPAAADRAAWALQTFGAVAVEPLIAIVRDPGASQLLSPYSMRTHTSPRSRAASVLGSMRDRRAVVPLIEALADHTVDDYGCRYVAAESLGYIGDPRAIEALTDALDDPHYLVRSQAASALVTFGLDQRIQVLTHLLETGDDDARKFAQRRLHAVRASRAKKEQKGMQG